MSEDIRKTDVLTPTAASVGLCLLGLWAAFFFIILPRLGGDAILGLVFGKDASLSLINSSKDSYGPLLEALLSNDLLGRAVVFGVWAFVGLCTFVIVTTVMNFIGSVKEQTDELGYVHQNKGLLVHNDVIIIVYRLGIALLWAGFLVFWIRFVLSYFAVTGFVALGQGGLEDWGIFLVAAIILFVTLHIQVVFTRLFVGKTRVWDD